MAVGDIDIWMILDILVLLLIGMGPKVALVPFLDLTADMDSDTRVKVANRMVQTATVVALILVLLGAFLMKLLHFSESALYIAGGIVFLLLALKMLSGVGDENDHHGKASERSAMQMALYPLAVPYLAESRRHHHAGHLLRCHRPLAPDGHHGCHDTAHGRL